MLLPLLLGQGGAGPATHAASGVLTGPSSSVVGSATRFAVHTTTGALNGGSAVIVGSAARSAGPVTHATTGVLAGLIASVAGSAARTRQHATSGVLSGPNAIVVGSAARTRAHATNGVLSAANAIIVGSASRTGAATSHDTTGVLTGPGSSLEGEASRASEQPEYLRGEGWGINHRGKQRSFKNERLEKEKFRESIEAALKPVTETKAKVVTVKGDVAVVTESQTIAIPATPKFDAQAVARMVVDVLQKQGIKTQRVRDVEARRQARIALQEQKRRILKRKRDDEIILLM